MGCNVNEFTCGSQIQFRFPFGAMPLDHYFLMAENLLKVGQTILLILSDTENHYFYMSKQIDDWLILARLFVRGIRSIEISREDNHTWSQHLNSD